jgi:ketol-acid reductoisomerase
VDGAPRYVESDGDLADLAGERVGVVGYGNLGRPAALNLRDSGLDVEVGSREEPDADRARADGFRVQPIDEVVATADVVWFALPDEVVPEVLTPAGARRPQPGSLLCFPSGYPLAYDLVKLPDDVDVVLLAPRMIGERIRTRYQAGQGFYSFVGVEQDATGTARRRLLALARAFGTLRAGAFELSAATEAALDLYVEQTVGPLLGAAVLGAFDVGTAQGLPPEALALELYLSGEMGATWDAFAEHGFFPGVSLHGHSAAFGGFLRLADIDQEAMRERFGAALEDIRSGGFARRFQDELAAGSPTRAAIEAMTSGDDPLSHAEAAVRGAAAGGSR